MIFRRLSSEERNQQVASNEQREKKLEKWSFVKRHGLGKMVRSEKDSSSVLRLRRLRLGNASSSEFDMGLGTDDEYYTVKGPGGFLGKGSL